MDADLVRVVIDTDHAQMLYLLATSGCTATEARAFMRLLETHNRTGGPPWIIGTPS